MSCVLRLSGNENLLPRVLQLGFEASAPRNSTDGRLATISVSTAEFDNLGGQIEDAILFLKKNSSTIKSLSASGCLDFGTEANRDNYSQSIRFPSELLSQVGDLNLQLEISLYKVSDDTDAT